MKPMKTSNNNKSQCVKLLLNNVIDKDVQSMLRPLNMMQSISLCPKYRIKNDFIYPNSRLSNFIALCGTICFISAFLLRLIILYFDDFVRKRLSFLFKVAHLEFGLYFIGYSLNCYSIIKVKQNINFVLTIQTVYIFFSNKNHLKFFTIVNWIYVLAIMFLYIISGGIILIYYLNTPVYTILVRVLFYSLDVNIIYSIRCLALLKDMVNLWNEEILNSQLILNMHKIDYCKRMFKIYADILSCYNIIQFIYKNYILFYIFELFSHSLIYIKLLIELLKLSETLDQDEPASSGDSGDESGSEPESPSEKLMQVHKQEWLQNENSDRESIKREPHGEPIASTSSNIQEADSSKAIPGLPKLLPKPMDLPGGAMLYHSSVLAGVGLDGIGNNLGLGNLAVGYPHSFILGLANQGQDGASSSTQPQFITIPLSVAMAAAAGAPSATVNNGCPSASSDDSSELQDLSTGRK